VNAGPYSAEQVCVGRAANSQGLVLIIDTVITRITRKEYRAARANGVPVYVMAMPGSSRSAEVQRFLDRERKHVIYKEPRNLSELGTYIEEAIVQYTNDAVWRAQYESRHAASRRKTTMSQRKP